MSKIAFDCLNLRLGNHTLFNIAGFPDPSASLKPLRPYPATPTRPAMLKDLRAFELGYARMSKIKRNRKRLLQKAELMDKGSVVSSQQRWRKHYGKARRNFTRYSKPYVNLKRLCDGGW